MEALPTGQTVISFLGWPSDPSLITQADQHAEHVAALAHAYTRGKGFSDDGATAEPALCKVIVSATARSLSNPSQARRTEAGAFSELPGSLASFSLLETIALDRYRVRMA